MAQPAGYGIPRKSLGTALSAPFIRLEHAASKNSTVWGQTLPGDFQSKAIKAAECSQVRAEEGSVIHEGLVEEELDLDNPILSQGPHLISEQRSELQLTQPRRPLHPQSGRARLIPEIHEAAAQLAVFCQNELEKLFHL